MSALNELSALGDDVDVPLAVRLALMSDEERLRLNREASRALLEEDAAMGSGRGDNQCPGISPRAERALTARWESRTANLASRRPARATLTAATHRGVTATGLPPSTMFSPRRTPPTTRRAWPRALRGHGGRHTAARIINNSSERLPSICFAHRTGCSRSCGKLHICTMFLAGICNFGEACRRGHTLTTPHNRGVLKDEGFEGASELQMICQLSRDYQEGDILSDLTYHRNLEVCLRHRSPSNPCVEGVCNRLHVCRRFISGECLRDDCRWDHQFKDSEHNMEVLRRHRAADLTNSELMALLREKLRGRARQALAEGCGGVRPQGRGGIQARGGARPKQREPSEHLGEDSEDAGAAAASVNEQLEQAGIPEQLQCPVCLDFLSKATTVQCGHTFCQLCIQDVRKHNPQCPMCRAAITHTTQALALDSLVDSMRKLMMSAERT